jgi:hypothetical protein
MEKLERNPLDVLESLIKLAELIESDWTRSEKLSHPLTIALGEIRWLNLKSVWFPRHGYIQEHLSYLANHLRELVGMRDSRDRARELQHCLSEIDRLQSTSCFGRFLLEEFDNSLPS